MIVRLPTKRSRLVHSAPQLRQHGPILQRRRRDIDRAKHSRQQVIHAEHDCPAPELHPVEAVPIELLEPLHIALLGLGAFAAPGATSAAWP